MHFSVSAVLFVARRVISFACRMNPFADIHIHEGSTLGSQIISIPSVTNLPGNSRADAVSESGSSVLVRTSNYKSSNTFKDNPTYDHIYNHSKLSASSPNEPNLNISLNNPFGLSSSGILATDGLPNFCATRLCQPPKCVGTPGQSLNNPLTGNCAQAI